MIQTVEQAVRAALSLRIPALHNHGFYDVDSRPDPAKPVDLAHVRATAGLIPFRRQDPTQGNAVHPTRIGPQDAPYEVARMLVWLIEHDVHRVTTSTLAEQLREAEPGSRRPVHYWNALFMQPDFPADLHDALRNGRPNVLAELARAAAIAGASAIAQSPRVAVVRTRNTKPWNTRYEWVPAGQQPNFGIIASPRAVETHDQRLTAVLLATLRKHGNDKQHEWVPWMYNPGSGCMQPSPRDRAYYADTGVCPRSQSIHEPASYLADHARWILSEADATSGQAVPIVFRANTYSDLQPETPGSSVLTPSILDQRDWASVLSETLASDLPRRPIAVQIDAPDLHGRPKLHASLAYRHDPEIRESWDDQALADSLARFSDPVTQLPNPDAVPWLERFPVLTSPSYVAALHSHEIPADQFFGVWRYHGWFHPREDPDQQLQALLVLAGDGVAAELQTVVIVGERHLSQMPDRDPDSMWRLLQALALAYHAPLDTHLGYQSTATGAPPRPGGCFETNQLITRGNLLPEPRENSMRVNSAIYGLLGALNQQAAEMGLPPVWNPILRNHVGALGPPQMPLVSH